MILDINPMNKNNEQDDFKLLGVFGIFKESIKLIMTWPNIFIPITLVSILPSCCISLVLYWSTSRHNQVNSPWHNNNVSGSISTEFIASLLMQAGFFIFSIVSSLISISTIVYTVYCIYTDKEITFKKAMSVVPKVWKPYMITYLCKIFVSLAYSLIVVAMLIFYYGKLGNIFLVLVVLFVVAGLLYMSMSWQLADVISVMEKICGFKALKKSRALIKGKVRIAFAIMLVGILCQVPIFLPKVDEQLFKVGVGIGVETVCYKILSVVWLTLVSLFLLVTISVFYFVCKAYHHEDIDKSPLSNGGHVYEYLGEYVSLKAEII